jgi:hypothetical protein
VLNISTVNASISFSIDEQFVVRNITFPGSFTVSRPLEVGDIFYRLDGVFLTSREDHHLSIFMREKSFPKTYSVDVMRQTAHASGVLSIQITQIAAFVPDSSWGVEMVEEVSTSTSTSEARSRSDSRVIVSETSRTPEVTHSDENDADPPQGVFVYGGVQWCMVECVCISCAK